MQHQLLEQFKNLGIQPAPPRVEEPQDPTAIAPLSPSDQLAQSMAIWRAAQLQPPYPIPVYPQAIAQPPRPDYTPVYIAGIIMGCFTAIACTAILVNGQPSAQLNEALTTQSESVAELVDANRELAKSQQCRVFCF